MSPKVYAARTRCYHAPDMRDALIFLLLVAVAVLGYQVHSQNAALADQQRRITELNSRLEAKSQTASLELQEKCSKQARSDFEEYGWKKEAFASFTNHYNEKMNKCFILIQSATPSSNSRDGTISINKYLFDAFEEKQYGSYSCWEFRHQKDQKKDQIVDCKATLPSGQEQVCRSSYEFDEIVKLYMQ